MHSSELFTPHESDSTKSSKQCKKERSSSILFAVDASRNSTGKMDDSEEGSPSNHRHLSSSPSISGNSLTDRAESNNSPTSKQSYSTHSSFSSGQTLVESNIHNFPTETPTQNEFFNNQTVQSHSASAPLPTSIQQPLSAITLPPRSRFPTTRYIKLRTIRKTLFGKVVLFMDTLTNRQVAIKLSDKQLLMTGTTTSGNRVAENPLEEIRVMNLLAGQISVPPFKISSLPDYLQDGQRFVLTSLGEYEDDAYLYTVMPFCSRGEFFDIVCRETRFSEDRARKYFIQMLLGIQFMHELGLAHLDISLENLLMTNEEDLKLCDYGLTRRLTYDPVLLAQHKPGEFLPISIPFAAASQNKPGKLGYMSPEIFYSQPFSGPLSDVWSMGVVLFISLLGVPPYQVPANSDQRFALIYRGDLLHLLQAWKMDKLISVEAMDLLQRMMSPEVRRISVSDIWRHPWIQMVNRQHAPQENGVIADATT